MQFAQQLLDADPEGRRRLIRRRPLLVGEREVHELAERARAAAPADPAESLRIAGVARELAEALGGARERALALRAEAIALRARARWVEAVDAFSRGATAAEEAGDPLLAAQIPIAAVDALAESGRREEALALAASLEARLRCLGAEEDAAKVVANTGNIHFRREAYLDALACWERALEFFRGRGQPVPVAGLQLNIASVFTHLNRLSEALPLYEAARAAMARAGMAVPVASIDLNLGFLLFMGGQYTESLQAYARARAQFERLDLAKELAVCDREVADIHLELNLVPEAREAYEGLLPRFEALRIPAEAARSALGLAMALHAQERHAEALAALGRAETAFRCERNELGVARAQLLRAEWGREGVESRPEHAERRRAARSALRAFRRHGVTLGALQARLRIAELRAAAGEHPARALHQLAREAEAGSYLSLLWRIQVALGRVCLARGRRTAALAHYRRAVEEVERARLLLRGDDFRIAFLHDKMRPYEELMALLLDRGTPAALSEGFQVAERAKSRSLLDLMAQAVETDGTGPGRRKLLAQLAGLRAQLNWDYGRLQQLESGASRLPAVDAALPERVRRLEREYLYVQRQIHLEGGTKEGGHPGVPVPEVGDLQALLQPDEQLVQYVTVRDEVLAFVIDRSRFRTARGLASRREVEQLVERLRFQWSKFAPGDYADRHSKPLIAATRDILAELYDLLLEPLAQWLPGPRLAVIPHGALHGIPFHALRAGGEDALDRWELVYAPSSAVWRACRLREDPASDRALIFGVADPTIAHVREEVAGLRRLLPAAEVYEDADATLSTVPAHGSYGCLHFATHAIFRQDNPVFSGLRLADGWLFASDLYRRRLDCRLATLSACRTGVSRVAPGDEALGLARAFLHAGARAVLVSLWTAHDAATAELMQHFYAHLAAGMPRAAALRAAQQSVRARYPHPYHWAAFTLVGAR